MYGYNYSSSSYSSKPHEYRPQDRDQPLDTVSHIIWDKFSRDPAFLAASWDGTVRYYTLKSGNNNSVEVDMAWSTFLQHPILSIDLSSNHIIFAGLATGDIAAVKMETGEVARVGSHEAPICGVFWMPDKECLMTLGFDNLIRFWQLNGSERFDHEIKLPLKTHACAFDGHYLAVGSEDSTFFITNLRNMPNSHFPNNPNDYTVKDLRRFSKFTCCSILGEKGRVSFGTVDGRSLHLEFRENSNGIQILDEMVSVSQKMSDSKGKSIYGQVNCIDLGCYKYDPFVMTGGSDDLRGGNLYKKSAMHPISSTTSSVGATTAVRLSPDLDFVAFATGCDWLKGLHELDTMKRPRIAVVKMTSQDLKDLTIH